MDTNRLVVGQEVCINGGVGLVWGKVVEVSPLCIYVETDWTRIRFKPGRQGMRP